MNSDLRSEDILFRVQEQLKKDKIKLWLDPYYDDCIGVGDLQEQALQLLCEQIVEKLNIDRVQCISNLRVLQNRALDRLKSNTLFKETGMACLRVKVSGEVPSTHTVNIPLTATETQLTEQMSSCTGIPIERIKLISQGRVLKPPDSLETQGVKNGSLLMAVILADQDDLQESEKKLKTLESTKKDVRLLAGRSNVNNEYYMQIENQSGEMLNLPHYERKALVTAMTLHEKGRCALKKDDYSLALVLFLEADKEYSGCTSELLNACDNYALLHLDIAWCYLCLRNAAQIPDADRRLSLCEQSFHKSYGPNLERLMAIKGTTGNESALFMRLHLLQGVVRLHQNKRVEARQLLERAQEELNGLKVDDKSLCMLLELGFTNAEALLGLRATHGNIEAAEELIQRKRRDRELTQERNRLKLKHDRERISLGMCEDGKQYCEPSLVQQLVDMGFDRGQTIAALKKANNVVGEAVSLIQEQPHLLDCPPCVSQESITQLASLGFDPKIAHEALKKRPELVNEVRSLANLLASGNNDCAAAASASTSAITFLKEVRTKRKAQEEKEHQAFERVSEGLIDNDLTEDHLYLNLDQEEQFLMEYMSLLN